MTIEGQLERMNRDGGIVLCLLASHDFGDRVSFMTFVTGVRFT